MNFNSPSSGERTQLKREAPVGILAKTVAAVSPFSDAQSRPGTLMTSRVYNGHVVLGVFFLCLSVVSYHGFKVTPGQHSIGIGWNHLSNLPLPKKTKTETAI